MSFSKLFIVVLFLWQIIYVAETQRTQLDVIFRDIYRPLRLLGLQFTGRSGNELSNVHKLENLKRTQKTAIRARPLIEFCNVKDGPGIRSAIRPNSVHRLRPGDIDIIGALGDSLTAGLGIFATKILHLTVENRGASFPIGGQGSWREYLTLPNILKEFNPNLYGYALSDSLSTERSSKFNVAETGAMSRDMPYMAKVLVKRLQRDPRVNMTQDWKIITLLIGANDICSDVCYYPNPMETIKWHERNMLRTYRYLRDNVPRLLLNVIPVPSLSFLTRLKGVPAQCQLLLHFECPCLIGKKSRKHLDYYNLLMEKWVAKDYEIVARDEFNTENFTINIQPFTLFGDLPLLREGKSDFSLLSEDCFHLSQHGQAVSANALWNNMLEMPGEKKSRFNLTLFEEFHCPTKERPYFLTRVNSKPEFSIQENTLI